MFEMIEGYILKKNSIGTEYIENITGEIVAKRCKKCNEMKSLDDYNKYTKKWSGKQPKCRECGKQYKKENVERLREVDKIYRQENKDQIRARINQWRQENAEHVKETNRIYRENNKDKIAEYFKEYWSNEENVKRRREYEKDYYLKNEEKIKAYRRKHYLDNKEKYDEMTRVYALEHREQLREYRKRWEEENSEHKKEVDQKYYQENKIQYRLNHQKYLARKNELPDELTKEQYELIFIIQKGECILSGASENLDLEHFIPISCGVGGTTFENCYYIAGSLNRSKGNRNPFEWIRTQPEEYQHRFHNILVPELAKRNNMTIEEFTEYVCGCFQKSEDHNEAGA